MAASVMDLRYLLVTTRSPISVGLTMISLPSMMSTGVRLWSHTSKQTMLVLVSILLNTCFQKSFKSVLITTL